MGLINKHMKSKREQIKDVLERHYHGRNRMEDRCSLELIILFEKWSEVKPTMDLNRTDADSENTEDDCFSDSLASDNYNDDEYGDS